LVVLLTQTVLQSLGNISGFRRSCNGKGGGPF